MSDALDSIDNYKYRVKNNIEFNELISEKMEGYRNLCSILKDEILEYTPEIKKGLDNFSHCIVQLKKQMCECNPICTDYSIKDLNFDSTCHDVDLDNLLNSKKHLPCEMFNIKIIDGIMYDIDDENVPNNLKEKIQELIYDLCQNTMMDLRSLQCATYELKDKCGDNEKCLDMRFTPVIIEECLNPNFNNQIREIEDMVGFHKFNVTFEDLQGIIRLPRSSGDYISQDNNTELISYTGICVFTLVIFLFGFIVFRLFRKTSKKDTKQDELDTGV